MIAQFFEQVPSKYYLGFLSVIVGLILGISIVYTSPLILVAALFIIILIPLIIKSPIIAILGIVILNSTILYGNANIGISIGIGHIYLNDILLLLTLILILLRAFVEPKFNLIHTPLDLPLLLFVGIAFFSTILAISRSLLTLKDSLGEVRVVANYLVFFAVTNLLREEKQLRSLANSLLVLATFVAGVMVIQFFIGSQLSFLPGRVENLTTQDTTYVGITRVLPPGQALVMVLGISTIALLALGSQRKQTVWTFLQCGLIILAIIVSFNRSFWAMTVIAVLVMAYLVRNRELPRLFALSLLGVVIVALVIFLVQTSSNTFITEFLNATLSRFGTLLTPTELGDNSLQWRIVENQYVLPQVIAHPFLGLGLGANYRPHNPNIGDLLAYIHNGHFWILMKTGILGYLCFAWVSIAFLVRSFKNWRLILDPQMRAYSLSFALTYLGVLFGAIVNPMFMQAYWSPLIGIMFGFNEAMFRLSPSKPVDLPAPGEA